jgi:hypothetical protein
VPCIFTHWTVYLFYFGGFNTIRQRYSPFARAFLYFYRLMKIKMSAFLLDAGKLFLNYTFIFVFLCDLIFDMRFILKLANIYNFVLKNTKTTNTMEIFVMYSLCRKKNTRLSL